MDLTRKIHTKMSDERLMFVYRGEITEKNSLSFLTLLENEMKDESYGLTGRKRLFMYLLESLQNITKHGDHRIRTRMPVIAYSKTDDGYTITTGNIISAAHVNNLKDRLEQVNKLDAPEIKELYKKILSTSEFSEKGGAGLGLIEMAVKTGNKLDFDFIPVNNDFSYFVLSKTVDSSGIGVHSLEKQNPFDSRFFMELEHMMAENGIHIIWSGHISSDIEEEVLSITESTLPEDNTKAGLRKRIFSIMVELLENISKYSPGKETGAKYGSPVAMVRIDEGKFILTTGNLILNQNVITLKEKIDDINNYDITGLKELFLKSLSQQDIETDSTGNLGLITVARKAGNKLNYRFEPVNDLYSFYLLAVKVEEVLA